MAKLWIFSKIWKTVPDAYVFTFYSLYAFDFCTHIFVQQIMVNFTTTLLNDNKTYKWSEWRMTMTFDTIKFEHFVCVMICQFAKLKT